MMIGNFNYNGASGSLQGSALDTQGLGMVLFELLEKRQSTGQRAAA